MVQEELIPFGERLRDQDPLYLTIPAARQAAMAVLRNSDFTLRELRSITVGGSDSEILVVDCTCDAVWSQNPAGIRYREPLALRFYADRDRMPEARALRRGFPVLLHTNEVPPQEPAWLCLYFEPWSAIIRTWTAQKFLARLQWWLVQSANGTLHPASQPPEQIYFESPISVVLPPNFDGLDPNTVRTLVLEPRSPQESPRWVLSAQARPTGNARPDLKFAWVTLRLPAIAHDRPERSPTTLGELDDRLRSRGAPVAEELFREIQRIAEGNGLAIVPGQRTLIILTIPTVNPAGGPPRIQRRGLLVEIPIGELGSMAGVLMRMTNPDRYVAVGTIGGLQLAPEWRAVSVHLVELHESFTDESARLYSGIDGPGPSGVLAGLGALGSVVADIWMREGWGRWTYIDPDLLLPHNLARHRGYERQIGVPKVEVIRQLESALYPGRQLPPVHQAKVNDSTNSDVQTSLSQADLIVDVTTTVEVPRDLSARDSSPRAASLFLTPSGRDSALLLEDASRKVRLDVLEAQYYRLVLGAAWGETHLVGHHGNLWVGAGCRDTSTVLSNEFVQLHAAVLARQLRMRSRSPDPVIQVWRMNPDTGTVDTTIAGVIQPLFIDLADMQLVWDEGVRLKIRALRSEGLPNETGGVLLGYFDLVNRRVYVVDALPAPPDSSRERSGFERGTEGLEANVDESKRRTADIVGYIGEWHSHPRNIEARPSNADIKLLLHLAAMLQQDGFPALMLIVGEDDERWLIGNVV